MKQSERQLLSDFLYLWGDIPFPKEINTLPVDGWRGYTQDMRVFHKAASDFLNGMIMPSDIGECYPPPAVVLSAIKKWVERRRANEWDFSYTPIEYGDEW